MKSTVKFALYIDPQLAPLAELEREIEMGEYGVNYPKVIEFEGHAYFDIGVDDAASRPRPYRRVKVVKL